MMLKKKKQQIYSSKYADTFDFILVGDPDVGKTCLLYRFCYDFYSSYNKKRKKPEIFTISSLNNNQEFKIQFWDTQFTEDNIEKNKKIIQKSDGIMFVCSYNNKESLKKILFWHRLLSSHININNKQISVFVNKSDLEEEIEIPEDDIRRISNELNTDYYIMSAKTGKGVKKAFGEFIVRVISKVYNISKSNQIMNGDEKANCNII